jgi:hypothetical protein
MLGWEMNSEAEKIWKEAVVAYSKQYLYTILDGLGKNTKVLRLERC